MTDRFTFVRAGLAVLALASAAGLTGCTRGHFSEEPPIHLNPNMDHQEKFRSQEENTFYADNAAGRMPVAGTVAQGWLKQDLQDSVVVRMNDRGALITEQTATPRAVEALSGHVVTLSGDAVPQYYTGHVSQAEGAAFLPVSPLPASVKLLERGRERYTIYCVPCHGDVGDGDGMVVRRGMLRPPAYTDERLLAMTDGELYNTITNGKNNMPGYRQQIPTPDRWAIVSYVRALQRSQHATLPDVPGGASALPQR